MLRRTFLKLLALLPTARLLHGAALPVAIQVNAAESDAPAGFGFPLLFPAAFGGAPVAPQREYSRRMFLPLLQRHQ